MVAFFVSFLRQCFRLADEKFAVTCNLFADHQDRQREIENFWIQQLALTRSNLRRSTVNNYSKYSQRKRRNKLPYGTCRVSVYDTQFVHHIRGAIQEYGGFEREEWFM
jgi:hypothetical protein